MMGRDRKAICALKEIQRVVDEQSNSEELWNGGDFKKELMRLHDAIERFTIPLFESAWLEVEEAKNGIHGL